MNIDTIKFPKHIDLVYVDYNEDLEGKQYLQILDACLIGKPDAYQNLDCEVWEAYSDSRIDRAHELCNELTQHLQDEFTPKEFEKLQEQVLEKIWDLDKSNPLSDLVQNTGTEFLIRAQHRIEIDRQNPFQDLWENLPQIRVTGSIETEIENSFDRLFLNILCKAEARDFVSPTYEGKSITFPVGSWVGFYDPAQGSGSLFEVYLSEPLTLSTSDENWRLGIDECFPGYSLDTCYGLCLESMPGLGD